MSKGSLIIGLIVTSGLAFYGFKKWGESSAQNKNLKNENVGLKNENNYKTQENNDLHQKVANVTEEKRNLENKLSELMNRPELPPQTA